MKYTIEQERLMKVIMKLFNEILPDFELPLKKKTYWGKGNRGYGSAMDDYTYGTTYYMDEDKNNWFIEYDENHPGNNVHWEVSDKLEPLYDYFGEDGVVLFIKWLFKIDLTEPTKKQFDWLFSDMGEVIDESVQMNGSVFDIPDENLVKIINKLVRHIYGEELKMVENESKYIRFYSSGPVPPYHRNLSGRLWVDDDRLEKIIVGVFGVDSEQAAALVAFYFSEKYGIKVTDARHQPHLGWFENEIDYKQFDDPTYKVPEDDDY